MPHRTYADHILEFNARLEYQGKLPEGIRILNPFRENPQIQALTEAFYHRFYGDCRTRKLILGINPGRLGAGATGIPFTDSKRLEDPCGIDPGSLQTHEPSSVFVYEVIAAMGGPTAFYNKFYINSVCPLGFVRRNARGNWVNCNYYDYPELYQAVKPFILENLRRQVGLGVDSAICIALGRKNAKYLHALNAEQPLFDRIVALDHPRYIVQYRSREMDAYVDRYREALMTG